MRLLGSLCLVLVLLGSAGSAPTGSVEKEKEDQTQGKGPDKADSIAPTESVSTGKEEKEEPLEGKGESETVSTPTNSPTVSTTSSDEKVEATTAATSTTTSSDEKVTTPTAETPTPEGKIETPASTLKPPVEENETSPAVSVPPVPTEPPTFADKIYDLAEKVSEILKKLKRSERTILSVVFGKLNTLAEESARKTSSESTISNELFKTADTILKEAVKYPSSKKALNEIGDDLSALAFLFQRVAESKEVTTEDPTVITTPSDDTSSSNPATTELPSTSQKPTTLAEPSTTTTQTTTVVSTTNTPTVTTTTLATTTGDDPSTTPSTTPAVPSTTITPTTTETTTLSTTTMIPEPSTTVPTTTSATTVAPSTTMHEKPALNEFLQVLKSLFDGNPEFKGAEVVEKNAKCIVTLYERVADDNLDKIATILKNKKTNEFARRDKDEAVKQKKLAKKVIDDQIEYVVYYDVEESCTKFFKEKYRLIIRGLSSSDLQALIDLYNPSEDFLQNLFNAHKWTLHRVGYPLKEKDSFELYKWYLKFFYEEMEPKKIGELAEILDNKESDNEIREFYTQQGIWDFVQLHKKYAANAQCKKDEEIEKFYGWLDRVLTGLNEKQINRAIDLFEEHSKTTSKNAVHCQ